MHRDYVLHIIPILSPTISLLQICLFTSLPSFYMHACIYEPSVFVVVVYKFVIHVRHIIDTEPYIAQVEIKIISVVM